MNTTRETILNKAFILFLLNGYDGMSMLKLQEETGLSRGALYHHFKSKDQLFKEVIETFYIHIPTTTDHSFSFLTLGIDAIKRYSGFREKIRSINTEVRKIWIYVVKTARENKEIQSEMSDSQIADCFIYLSEGIGTRFTLEGRGSDAGDELIKLWDGFYNEIKSKNQ